MDYKLQSEWNWSGLECQCKQRLKNASHLQEKLFPSTIFLEKPSSLSCTSTKHTSISEPSALSIARHWVVCNLYPLGICKEHINTLETLCLESKCGGRRACSWFPMWLLLKLYYYYLLLLWYCILQHNIVRLHCSCPRPSTAQGLAQLKA